MLFPIIPTVPKSDPVFSTLYTKTLTTSQAFASNSIVCITPNLITGFSKFRLTVKNGSDTTATIDSLYFGQLSGTYSFAATPAQVTWGGGASTSLTFSTADEEIVSNIISFTPSGTAPFIFAFDVNADNSSVMSLPNNPTGWALYKKSGADASTPSKSGYLAYGKILTALVTKVEVAA